MQPSIRTCATTSLATFARLSIGSSAKATRISRADMVASSSSSRSMSSRLTYNGMTATTPHSPSLMPGCRRTCISSPSTSSSLLSRRRSGRTTRDTTSPAPAPAPLSFLRAFSSTSYAAHANLSTGSLSSLLQSRFPRLRSGDSASNSSSRRKQPSPLFGQPHSASRRSGLIPSAPSSFRPSPSPFGSNRPGGPWGPNSIFARLDTLLFSRLPSRFVLYTIVALNVVVFGAWYYASESLRKFSDPRAYLFLSKNFLSGYTNVAAGRWWTMLTSCVSHERLDHFVVNMISLSFMAPPVLALTGPSAFVALYFGAGVISSIVSMVAKRLIPTDSREKSARRQFSHGASGSVYAIMSAFACVMPKATFLVFFVIPAPAWAVVSGIFAWDLWHAAKTPGAGTDSAGHVGGIVAGILFWRFGLRGVRVQP